MNVVEARLVFLVVGAHFHAQPLVRCHGGLGLGSRGHRGQEGEEQNAVHDEMII